MLLVNACVTLINKWVWSLNVVAMVTYVYVAEDPNGSRMVDSVTSHCDGSGSHCVQVYSTRRMFVQLLLVPPCIV